MAFETFSQLSKRRRSERAEEFKKKVLLAVFSGIFLLACVAGGVFAFLHFREAKGKTQNEANFKKGSSNAPPGGTNGGGGGGDVSSTEPSSGSSGKIAHLLCEPTDYKETCQGALTKLVDTNAPNPAIEPRVIIKTAILAAQDSVAKVTKETGGLKFEKPRDKAAFDVCKKLFQDSSNELSTSANHTEKQEDFTSRIADIKTWLSAVYSYQETCIDAFPDGKSKDEMKKALNSTKENISNSIALISQIATLVEDESRVYEAALAPDSSSTTGEAPGGSARRLLSHRTIGGRIDEEGFPAWVGREERKLGAATKVTADLVPNITVAKDGSGNYSSINECLKNLPENRKDRIFIFVKEGFYEEYVTITEKMVNVTMYGVGSQKSMITGNKNFADGIPTFETATFVVLGEGFIGIAIGFKNTAGPEKKQAVALRVQADHAIFLNCRMEGYQNALYAQVHRQFYRSCYITGTVDFIFGDAAAIFQNCELMVRKPLDDQKNTITAQARADSHQTTGFVLHNCKIQPAKDLEPEKLKVKTYLGRPMKEYSRTIVMESNIGELVQPEGWVPWQGNFALKTLSYAEFNNNGPGADTFNRVSWPGYKKSITRQQAQNYTVMRFLQGSWIARANVPTHYNLLS